MNTEIGKVFESIFSRNAWGGTESASGDGSSMASTEAIRAAIPEIIKEFKIRSVLDIPCGDFNWMRTLEIENYIGADIVLPMIESLRAKYPEKHFEYLDVTSDLLPRADLVLCRDCLVHLPYADIFKAVNNIIDSGALYLLATTFPKHDKNEDPHDPGRWRQLNLQAEPFNFPTPAKMISENTTSNKYLGLWETINLKRYGEICG
jgi:2-polyprenyl-3-methyl-5-hydroxy-6-metoxy-1,4-benzoquinol methylase